MPCTNIRSWRLAVTRGSFCRSEPAAALRGLANGALPAATSEAFELGERLDREEDLAADLDQLGNGCVVGAGQHVRDALDGADVQRDVLAGAAVAAGERPG